ncbi:MAG: hypothetical protein NTX79_02650 [Candidatus Micrarchaeota archaeon]|nr:hypothetical protein [Candidatus Micrarchaeota archaeon]
MKKAALIIVGAALVLAPLGKGTMARGRDAQLGSAPTSIVFRMPLGSPAMGALAGAVPLQFGNASRPNEAGALIPSEKERTKMQEFVLKDPRVGAIQGIDGLLQNIIGQCILADLCRIGKEKGASQLTVKTVALAALEKYSRLKSYFDEKYETLSSVSPDKPQEKMACVAAAFDYAMEKGGMKDNDNTRNLARGLSSNSANCTHASILLAGFCEDAGLDVAFAYGIDQAAPNAPGHLLIGLLGNGGAITYFMEPTPFLDGQEKMSEYSVADMLAQAIMALSEKRGEFVEKNRELEERMLKQGPYGIEDRLSAYRAALAAMDSLEGKLEFPPERVLMEKGVFPAEMWMALNAGRYSGWRFEYLHRDEFFRLYSGEAYRSFGTHEFEK